MDKTSLGNRMKQYEATTKSILLRRTPTIIRVDGKAFHTWTKQLPAFDMSLKTDPFSNIMQQAMAAGMLHAMHEMQNVKIAYAQSDEISFLLKDWDTHETQQWYGGGIQKIASVTASLVTAGFIKYLASERPDFFDEAKLPAFDARVFQVPKEEVANYFVWRQQDATRNSINMLGQYYFPHEELHGKKVNQVQDMLMEREGVNWNDIDTWKKRGYCGIFKRGMCIDSRDITNPNPTLQVGGIIYRTSLVVDTEIPIFTSDREYIESLL